jgi:hypothetical protein
LVPVDRGVKAGGSTARNANGRLWFDRWIYLDGLQSWQLPAELLLDFMGARGVLFSLEYAAVGPDATGAATGVEIDYRRSAVLTANEDAVESMFPAASLFYPARTFGVRHDAFGADGPANSKYPRGYGSVRVKNNHATNWVAVRLRIWVALEGVGG